jgi:hypothetical protein
MRAQGVVQKHMIGPSGQEIWNMGMVVSVTRKQEN